MVRQEYLLFLLNNHLEKKTHLLLRLKLYLILISNKSINECLNKQPPLSVHLELLPWKSRPLYRRIKNRWKAKSRKQSLNQRSSNKLQVDRE